MQVGRSGRWVGKGKTPGEPSAWGIGDPLQHGAEKPERHESGLADPPTGMEGWQGEGAETGMRLARCGPAKGRSKRGTSTQNAVLAAL